jgi:hypothetical protein
MIKRVVELSFLTIGTYLLVYYSSGSGTLINSAGSQGVNLVKAFQGR